MVRGFLIIVGLAGLSAAALFILRAGEPAAPPQPPTPGISAESETKVGRGIDKLEMPTINPHPPKRGAARIVGANRIAVPHFEIGELERLPPREPLGKPDDRDADGQTDRILLHRPIATAVGLVKTQGHTIRLTGIRPFDEEARCAAASGNSVPCNRLALTAFRAWIRGRSIKCDVPAAPSPNEVEATCELAGKDMGAWLVENGWADADNESTYAALEETAQNQRRGFFRTHE